MKLYLNLVRGCLFHKYEQNESSLITFIVDSEHER
jgi:hypothetical protein